MTTTLDATIDSLTLFADPSRVRLAALLSRHELSVAELVSVTGLAQSRVSSHLARLREAGVLRDRRVGSSTRWVLVDEQAMPAGARNIWSLVREQVKDGVLESDRQRCEVLLRARDGNAAWADRFAGEMERHYSPGRTWEATARALVGLARLGDVLDAGSGDGTIAELVAPRARSVTCLDRSERMIEAARARLSEAPNVRCVVGDAQAMPFADASFDQALVLNALTMIESPARALAEIGRVLRPGGSLVLVTLAKHDRLDVAAGYGHVHPGFSLAALRKMIQSAGLAPSVCEVTSRERRAPCFAVVTAFADKAARGPSR